MSKEDLIEALITDLVMTFGATTVVSLNLQDEQQENRITLLFSSSPQHTTELRNDRSFALGFCQSSDRAFSSDFNFRLKAFVTIDS